MKHPTIILLAVAFLPCCSLSAPAQGEEVAGKTQLSSRTVWIYRHDPPPTLPDGSSRGDRDPERFFSPDYFMPERMTDLIRVNPACPLSRAGDSGEGTCIEVLVELQAPDDWATVAFVPRLGRLGTVPGLNIAEALKLGFGRRAVLKLRARARKGDRVAVKFLAGGMAYGEHVDGIPLPRKAAKSAVTSERGVTILDNRKNGGWVEVEIDLGKDSEGLKRVVSPLRIEIKGTAQPQGGSSPVVVFVDDVRYALQPSERKKGR